MRSKVLERDGDDKARRQRWDDQGGGGCLNSEERSRYWPSTSTAASAHSREQRSINQNCQRRKRPEQRPLILPTPLGCSTATETETCSPTLPVSYIRGQLLNPIFVCLALFGGASENIYNAQYDVNGAQVVGKILDARPWLPIEENRINQTPFKRYLLHSDATSRPLSRLHSIESTVTSPQRADSMTGDRRKRRRRRYTPRRPSSNLNENSASAVAPPEVTCVQSGGPDWELHWTALGCERVKYFFANVSQPAHAHILLKGSDATSASNCRLRCQTAADIIRQFSALWKLLNVDMSRRKTEISLIDPVVEQKDFVSLDIDIGVAAFTTLDDCVAYRQRYKLAVEILRGEFSFEEAIRVRISRWLAERSPYQTPELRSAADTAFGKPDQMTSSAVSLRVSDDGMTFFDYERPRIRPQRELTDLLLVDTPTSSESREPKKSVKEEKEPYIIPPWLERLLVPAEIPPQVQRKRKSPPPVQFPTAQNRRWQQHYDPRRN